MQINNLSLEQQLKAKTPRYFLLWGSENFLIEQSRKTIIEHLANLSINEKVFISFEHKEKALQQLSHEISTQGLFCQNKLLVCQIGTNLKPQERKEIASLLPSLPESYTLIFICEKISAQQQKEHWYQYIQENGLVVKHWPMSLSQYRQYIQQIAQKNKVNLSKDAIVLLCEMTQGNAVAGMATIETLVLHQLDKEETEISAQQLMGAVSRHSMFNLNDLYQAVLMGHKKQIQDILQAFKQAQTPLPLIVWGLHQLIQAICQPALNLNQLKNAPVLPKTTAFAQLVSKKQRSITAQFGADLFHQLHELDKKVKGFQIDNCWEYCQRLCLQLAVNSSNYAN